MPGGSRHCTLNRTADGVHRCMTIKSGLLTCIAAAAAELKACTILPYRCDIVSSTAQAEGHYTWPTMGIMSCRNVPKSGAACWAPPLLPAGRSSRDCAICCRAGDCIIWPSIAARPPPPPMGPWGAAAPPDDSSHW